MSGWAEAADELGAVLGSSGDVVFVQAEAVVALEAVASGLAGPGVRVLNVITGPYGAGMGAWLRRGGAEVVDLAVPAGAVAQPDAVRRALEPGFDVVSVVHGEAATGVLNPLDEISAAARDAGAVLVVDAVASVGGEPVRADAWGAAVVVAGPQKALQGPVSLSAVAVDDAGWRALERGDDRIGASVLNLHEQRRNWLATGRGRLPGTADPAVLEALRAALDELAAEGLDRRIARHRAAADRAREGLRALGLELVPARDADASHLVTLARAATPVDPASGVAAAPGEWTVPTIRLAHWGREASADAVERMLTAIASGRRAP